MEEWIGARWDRWVTQAARRDHPCAAIELKDIEKTLGVFFRALGGDAGLRVVAAADCAHGARRRLLQRIAGIGMRTAHAALDREILRLPPRLAVLPTPDLNRDLYLWLAALAARTDPERSRSPQHWIAVNQQATLRALQTHPGLLARYRRLVLALLNERIAPDRLPEDEAAQERAIRQALLVPGSVAALPAPKRGKVRTVQPVPLWLMPAPIAPDAAARAPTPNEREGAPSQEQQAPNKRYQAERVEMPSHDSPMILPFRAESLLSWAEFVKVNRATDDDPNPDAGRAAISLDRLMLAGDDDTGQQAASKVRLDLDLPPAAEDDLALGPGILLPEWDWRRQRLKPDYCRVQPMAARQAEPCPLPERLRRSAQRLKSQFAALAPARRWLKGQPDGIEPDIDACVRIAADRRAGRSLAGTSAYLDRRPADRDLACLVLADLSLSTDAHANDEQRVIDVIRDSLMLFGDALTATGDRFAFYGFSSLRRSFVRFHEIKPFDRPFDAMTRGRIAALKPGYYTRLGAAVRRTVQLLEPQPSPRRLLLVLSDGKPHDTDLYEGRYGIEDTRHALAEARNAGIKPFFVTIDREAAAYLPHMCGPNGFVIMRKPEELLTRLPQLYAQLTDR